MQSNVQSRRETRKGPLLHREAAHVHDVPAASRNTPKRLATLTQASVRDGNERIGRCRVHTERGGQRFGAAVDEELHP